MQNVEYKAELREPTLARAALLSVGCVPAERMRQTDTYFQVVRGRFKRREIEVLPDPADAPTSLVMPATTPSRTEWIVYDRPNEATARVSDYHVYTQAQAHERYGDLRLPELIVVRKERELLLYERLVRVHLDAVENLGSFLEFEALITPDQPQDLAAERLDFLRNTIRPWLGEAISTSYSDLVLAESDHSNAADKP